MAPLEPQVLAAMITGGLALLGACISIALSLRERRYVRRQETELAKLKAELEEQRSSREAYRAYKFDALKRLYDECEPLLFQLIEHSSYTLKKCRDFGYPRTWHELAAKRQNTDPECGYWMLTDSSEAIASLYELLAPVAVFRLLREKITVVDLSLDSRVWIQYLLARQLYDTFHDDAALAAIPPLHPYDPLTEDWRRKRLNEPAIYWWQGMSRGRLDSAIDILIKIDEVTRRRQLVTFGEFESLYKQLYNSENREHQKVIGIAANAIYGFQPNERPIFWRLLLTQAHLHRALQRTNQMAPLKVIGQEKLAGLGSEIRELVKLESYADFDWPSRAPDIKPPETLDETINASLTYLEQQLFPYLSSEPVRKRLESLESFVILSSTPN
jgi:hypothetical protein